MQSQMADTYHKGGGGYLVEGGGGMRGGGKGKCKSNDNNNKWLSKWRKKQGTSSDAPRPSSGVAMVTNMVSRPPRV